MSRLTVKAIGVETSWCKKNVHTTRAKRKSNKSVALKPYRRRLLLERVRFLTALEQHAKPLDSLVRIGPADVVTMRALCIASRESHDAMHARSSQ